MRYTYLLILGGSICLSIPAFARSMNAEVFYQRAAALEQMGATAVLSSDYDRILAEARSAMNGVQRENAVARRTGKPLYCPPKSAQPQAEQLFGDLRAMGKLRRKAITTQVALRNIMIQRYPCR